MVTQMAAKIMTIWSKFENFDREINIEHKQIQKKYFNIWRDVSRQTPY